MICNMFSRWLGVIGEQNWLSKMMETKIHKTSLGHGELTHWPWQILMKFYK